MRFTPSKSEQRLHPPYYRGCWHGVSRCFFCRYRQGRSRSSLLKGLYTPKCFIIHAALLRQPLGHCAIFPTAASRRSLGRISVPVWPITLSGRLSIVALVGRYPANRLMDRGTIFRRIAALIIRSCGQMILCGIRPPFEGLSPTRRQVSLVLLTRLPLYSGPKALSRATCMYEARRQRSF